VAKLNELPAHCLLTKLTNVVVPQQLTPAHTECPTKRSRERLPGPRSAGLSGGPLGGARRGGGPAEGSPASTTIT